MRVHSANYEPWVWGFWRTACGLKTVTLSVVPGSDRRRVTCKNCRRVLRSYVNLVNR